ncbi:MAG: hypothetical protein IT162_07935 [Bryobacterales bacterium]|nr:hypothetical protein [Bryobacterales bacterium]
MKRTAITALFLLASSSAWAGDEPAAPPPPQNEGGWRRVGDTASAPRDEFGQTAPAAAAASQPAAPVPDALVIPAGTWVRIRLDQPLSSDRSAAGETFSASLSQPIVADGFVVARRGQILEGRVTEAVKAGKRSGTSRLGIELITLSLVDGRQMPVRTQLMEFSGGKSVGRDVAAAGTATGTGAAIGAVAGGGPGAAIGAAVGAAAAGIGILTTRGKATEIYPEAEVTFRTMEPITINTTRAASAFQPVRQGDFEPRLQERRTTTVVRQAPVWGGSYWGSYWGPGWGGYYDPFWGPGFGFYSRPRVFIGGGWGRGGGRGRR